MSITLWVKKNKIVTMIAAVGIVLVITKCQGPGGKSDGQFSEPIKKGTIIESVYGIGTVHANKIFQFKAGVINTLHKVNIQEGDTVKQGTPLIELDGGVIVKAPFDGTITKLPFKIDETIFPESIILEVVDLQDRYLLVDLEQRGALRVSRGQRAALSFDGMRNQSFQGVVDSIYSSGNNFLVRINLSDLPPQILPGMTADTAIGIREAKDVLLIPVAAIEEGKVEAERFGGRQSVAVTTGIVDGAFAEVASGDLKEGDRLFIRKDFGK